jgi:hypothetical protein
MANYGQELTPLPTDALTQLLEQYTSVLNLYAELDDGISRSGHDLPPPEFAWMRRRVSTSVGRSHSRIPPSMICPMIIA